MNASLDIPATSIYRITEAANSESVNDTQILFGPCPLRRPLSCPFAVWLGLLPAGPRRLVSF